MVYYLFQLEISITFRIPTYDTWLGERRVHSGTYNLLTSHLALSCTSEAPSSHRRYCRGKKYVNIQLSIGARLSLKHYWRMINIGHLEEISRNKVSVDISSGI